jgi:hypothetical protein
METDMLIFAVVVAGRLLLPLLIFRYPFPGIIICLVLDGIDQTIFQQFTTLNLDGYQGYDKALDIYYLTIAYISTLRNWTNRFAFKVSRFLFYYRMIGVTLYEFLYLGIILLIFPNTFEYFFIYIEAVRLKWNPDRLSRKHILAAAAGIWIFIKLPQEYWIHIAHMDMTDFLKEHVFHVPLDAGPSEILSANPWIIPFLIGLTALIILGTKWAMKRLPKPDWKLTFNVDKHLELPKEKAMEMGDGVRGWLFNSKLTEKVVMVSLITIIFSTVLPGVRASIFEIILGVAVVVFANVITSHWLSAHGRHWKSIVREFFGMALVNFGIVMLYANLLVNSDEPIQLGITLFFALLLTLLVTLYDRYRHVYDLRFSD